MSTDESKRKGRPKVADEGASVTLRVEASKLEMADEIAADMGTVIAGMKPTRGDILRAALARGLDAMRAEVAAKASKR